MAWNINSIPDETKGEMYKALANKSYAQVAVEFRIDIHYKDSSGYRNAMYRIAREVEANPEKYGVTPEVIEIVKTSMEDRQANPQAGKLIEAKHELVDFSDITQVTQKGRDKLAQVIHKKIDLINNDRKQLEKVNLVQLTTAFGTMFDKARLLQGETTENIQMKAKITKDMTPEESLQELLKMRESQVQDLYDKK